MAIGLTIPHYGVELARYQLAPPWFDHATLTGTLYGPDQAREAGFLHEIVDRRAGVLAATRSGLAAELAEAP